MNESEAIEKMVMPGRKRPGAYMGGIIQIHVTRACDLACFHCTQGSQLAGKTGFMPPDKFEQAVLSLADYFGVIGVFGGNPALSPHFPAYCEILRRHIPKKRCGLWCNNINGHGAVARNTFNPHHSNLNVHMSQAAFDEFKRDWPESKPLGMKDSRHSPPFVAMQDMDYLPFPDGSVRENTEENRWELIAGCDVNQNWSAMICVFRGELRAFFCEIAAAQSILHQWEPEYPDTGMAVEPGWWSRPTADFINQIRQHCHGCGVPMRGHGDLAVGGNSEQVSKTHAAVYKPKRIGRPVVLVETIGQLNGQVGEMTKYIQNATK
jgi:hypothetical protein